MPRRVPESRSSLSRKLYQPIVQIQESRIRGAGYGAFANRDLVAGQFLGFYLGEECEMGSNGDYVLEVEERRFDRLGNPQLFEKCIDAQDPKLSNWTRYINSIRPGDGLVQNVKFKLVGDDIGVFALRNIPKGSELQWNQGNEQF